MKKIKFIIFLIVVGLIVIGGFKLGDFEFNKLGGDPEIDLGDFNDDGVYTFSSVPYTFEFDFKD